MRKKKHFAKKEGGSTREKVNKIGIVLDEDNEYPKWFELANKNKIFWIEENRREGNTRKFNFGGIFAGRDDDYMLFLDFVYLREIMRSDMADPRDLPIDLEPAKPCIGLYFTAKKLRKNLPDQQPFYVYYDTIPAYQYA